MGPHCHKFAGANSRISHKLRGLVRSTGKIAGPANVLPDSSFILTPSSACAGLNVWKKELVDGSVAVAVYNSRNSTSGETELRFETVGFSSVDHVSVRDLVNHKGLGVRVGSMAVPLLPAHGVALFNVSVVWPQQKREL